MGACGSKPIPPNPHAIDLSHFELLKVVGKGGFGKVNAITKLDTNELLALKRMEKFAVLQSQSHLNMVWIERRIMSLTTSPFLCYLMYAFENETELFLVMPFMQGGDLRYHLKERGTMSEEVCRFYAAELLCGLADLHAKRVVFRDLKPENLLLDAEGHLRISDFGLAHVLRKEDNYKITGQAGTRGYQSPEVITDQFYGCEVDIWSYGVTIYELLHGTRPWKDWSRLTEGATGESGGSGEDSARLKEFHISSRLSPETHSFLRQLLHLDIKKRLGCGSRGWDEVREHPFFKGINWQQVYAKKVTPPITPDLSHANCTADADLADQLLDRKPRPITPEQQKHFRGWAYNTEIKGKNITAVESAAEANGANSPTHQPSNSRSDDAATVDPAAIAVEVQEQKSSES